MKKRTFSNNQIMAALFVCFLIAAIIIIISAKRDKPDETNDLQPDVTLTGDETPQPATSPSTQNNPVLSLLGGSKIKLSDVIEASKTKSWMPELALYQGKTAPDITLTDITGTTHSLKQYQGKPVLLLIWTPKGSSIPQLQELKELKAAGLAPDLQILCLSYESPLPLVNQESIRQFARENTDITFPLCVASMDSVPSPYNQIDSVPCSFFITPEGRIKLTALGLVLQDDIKSILAAQ